MNQSILSFSYWDENAIMTGFGEAFSTFLVDAVITSTLFPMPMVRTEGWYHSQLLWKMHIIGPVAASQIEPGELKFRPFHSRV